MFRITVRVRFRPRGQFTNWGKERFRHHKLDQMGLDQVTIHGMKIVPELSASEISLVVNAFHTNPSFNIII